MIVQKRPVAKARKKTPYPFTGHLVLSDGTAEEEALIANFAENVWNRNSGQDYQLMFVPTDTETYFWVSAATQRRVNSVLNWGLKNLQGGFAQMGYTLQVG